MKNYKVKIEINLELEAFNKEDALEYISDIFGTDEEVKSVHILNIIEKQVNKIKVAVVTGASFGIGRAIAIGLSEIGYKVFACARRMELLEELCDTKNGNNIVPVCLDITDVESISNFKKIIGNNKINILVNSAGGNRTPPKGSALKYSSIDLHECMDLNMYGTFNVIQAVVPNMKKEENPLIITLSSIAGQTVTSGVLFPYHMAKNAESNLLKYLSRDLHPIRVTDLIISTVNSFEYEEMEDESMTPNDIFNVVKFLCESPQYLAINQIDLRHIGKGER